MPIYIMSEAAYRTGVQSLDDEKIEDLLDQFVTNVVSTTNVMWAASRFSDVDMSEDVGTVANNLHIEALYLRRRMDRETEKRLEELQKQHPERFKNGED